MSIVLQSTGGGSVSIVEPTTASNFTQTLPAATGTVMVSGNMPAFFVYLNGTQSGITRSSWTKIAFNGEVFDTANAFDSTTNYRFTPQVAGYYLISLVAEDATGLTSAYQSTNIYKNGSGFCKTLVVSSAYGTSGITTAIVYLNGSTDYIEGYYQASGSGTCSLDGSTSNGYNTFMSGSLIRGA